MNDQYEACAVICDRKAKELSNAADYIAANPDSPRWTVNRARDTAVAELRRGVNVAAALAREIRALRNQTSEASS